jgi:hypothetical protein
VSKTATRSFLALLTATAVILEDAGVVVSLNGAVMGSAIIYAFPAIIFLKLTSRLMAEEKMEKPKKVYDGTVCQQVSHRDRIFDRSLRGIRDSVE